MKFDATSAVVDCVNIFCGFLFCCFAFIATAAVARVINFTLSFFIFLLFFIMIIVVGKWRSHIRHIECAIHPLSLIKCYFPVSVRRRSQWNRQIPRRSSANFKNGK